MRTEALRAEQVQQRRRDEIRAMVDGLLPGQWVSRSGGEVHIRTGHAIDHDDVVRMLGRGAFTGEPCEVCTRSRWVPVTRVTGKDRSGHERLADRVLCRSCGHERPDEREITSE